MLMRSEVGWKIFKVEQDIMPRLHGLFRGTLECKALNYSYLKCACRPLRSFVIQRAQHFHCPILSSISPTSTAKFLSSVDLTPIERELAP